MSSVSYLSKHNDAQLDHKDCHLVSSAYNHIMTSDPLAIKVIELLEQKGSNVKEREHSTILYINFPLTTQAVQH